MNSVRICFSQSDPVHQEPDGAKPLAPSRSLGEVIHFEPDIARDAARLALAALYLPGLRRPVSVSRAGAGLAVPIILRSCIFGLPEISVQLRQAGLLDEAACLDELFGFMRGVKFADCQLFAGAGIPARREIGLPASSEAFSGSAESFAGGAEWCSSRAESFAGGAEGFSSGAKSFAGGAEWCSSSAESLSNGVWPLTLADPLWPAKWGAAAPRRGSRQSEKPSRSSPAAVWAAGSPAAIQAVLAALSGAASSTLDGLLDQNSEMRRCRGRHSSSGSASPDIGRSPYFSRIASFSRITAIGVSGPTKASRTVLDEASRVGRLAAEEGWVLVSGGAPGVDQAAEAACLNAGGLVLELLPCGAGVSWGLRQEMCSLEGAKFGGLAKISLAPVQAPFSAALAMERNRAIFWLADAVFVLEAEPHSGGSWHGASEALRIGQTPVLIPESRIGAEGSGISQINACGRGASGSDACGVKEPANGEPGLSAGLQILARLGALPYRWNCPVNEGERSDIGDGSRRPEFASHGSGSDEEQNQRLDLELNELTARLRGRVTLRRGLPSLF